MVPWWWLVVVAVASSAGTLAALALWSLAAATIRRERHWNDEI